MSNILVIDDAADVRILTVAWLGADYRVVTCADGESALRSLTEQVPDVCLVDAHLGLACGFELAAALRRALPAARIFMMSAEGDESYVTRAKELGCAGLVPKPLSRAKLTMAVGRAPAPVAPALTTTAASRHVGSGDLAARGSTPALAVPVDMPDEDLGIPQDLLAQLHAELDEQVAQAIDALAIAQYSSLWHIGHRIAGTTASFGMPGLSQLGRQIQVAAELRNARTLDALLLQLGQRIAAAKSAPRARR